MSASVSTLQMCALVFSVAADAVEGRTDGRAVAALERALLRFAAPTSRLGDAAALLVETCCGHDRAARPVAGAAALEAVRGVLSDIDFEARARRRAARDHWRGRLDING